MLYKEDYSNDELIKKGIELIPISTKVEKVLCYIPFISLNEIKYMKFVLIKEKWIFERYVGNS
jgi:hypothetical protein